MLVYRNATPTPQHYFALINLYTWVERRTTRREISTALTAWQGQVSNCYTAAPSPRTNGSDRQKISPAVYGEKISSQQWHGTYSRTSKCISPSYAKVTSRRRDVTAFWPNTDWFTILRWLPTPQTEWALSLVHEDRTDPQLTLRALSVFSLDNSLFI